MRVAVVGGGIAGLSAAYDLTRSGVETILFEKRPRLGGVIETQTWDGCTFDAGPDSFLSAKPEALALIRELGLEDQVIGSNDRERVTYIVKNGRLVPFPEGMMMIAPSKPGPVLKTRLLGWRTKLRMARELLRGPGPGADRSVSDFVIDHFGREALDYLAEPLLSGVYGGDPAQLSVASVLPRFLEMEAKTGSLARAAMLARRAPSHAPLFRTLKDGLGVLAAALSKNLNVRHETVESIEAGFRIRSGGDWICADRVILACPAWSSADLVAGLDSGLAAQLAAIPYSSSLTLSLVYQASEFDGRRAGFGFLVPARERRRMAACTFVGTKFPHRAPPDKIVLRCFFGGIGDEAILAEPDESVIEIARGELRRILGVTAPPLYRSISRWPRSMAQYTVGHLERVRAIRERAAKIPGLYLAGNAYDGIGIPDCIRTGRAAAHGILTAGRP